MNFSEIKNCIDKNKIPEHVAIIMDGNGRWAKKQNKPRIFGHQSATNAVRNAIESATELGVKFLTLYAFSSENWKRPQNEIDFIMDLLVENIEKESPLFFEHNLKFEYIGEISELPINVQNKINDLKEKTKNHKNLSVVVALNYGSRNEIKNSIKKILKNIIDGNIKLEDITEETISKNLYTFNMPDPELIIRTSNEFRLSNFLLWQASYSELIILEKYWPEFLKEDFYKCIVEFQNRTRRFGKINEQLK